MPAGTVSGSVNETVCGALAPAANGEVQAFELPRRRSPASSVALAERYARLVQQPPNDEPTPELVVDQPIVAGTSCSTDDGSDAPDATRSPATTVTGTARRLFDSPAASLTELPMSVVTRMNALPTKFGTVPDALRFALAFGASAPVDAALPSEPISVPPAALSARRAPSVHAVTVARSPWFALVQPTVTGAPAFRVAAALIAVTTRSGAPTAIGPAAAERLSPSFVDSAIALNASVWTNTNTGPVAAGEFTLRVRVYEAPGASVAESE